MIIYYRISDCESKLEQKLAGTNKLLCFNNFLKIFGDNDIFLIFDNCSEKLKNEILKLIKKFPLINYTTTNLGNSGSCKYAFNEAIKNNDNEIVYFVEDDYLHHPNSVNKIEEGLQVAQYTTLYDHPDKYTKFYDYGEICKILKTNSQHWKHSISTTMTFATKISTLKKDIEIWEINCASKTPNDHQGFIDVKKINGHVLSVAIPGLAFHTDLSALLLKDVCQIDQWILDYTKEELTKQIYSFHDGDMEDAMHEVLYHGDRGIYEKLICLDQIVRNKIT